MDPLTSSSASASASSSRSCKYDVFLSFRGEDTRKKFVDHLYSALERHLLRVYKDDVALPRGNDIDQSLFEAIEESRIAVVILSENYPDSSWCLEELAHIMKCKDERELVVIPIFYDVAPTEVRNQKRKFGEAFAKQEAKNVTKAEIWRKSLVDVSNIAGWEPKNTADGLESQFTKIVIDAILDRLFMLNSCVNEDLVGMRARFQKMESLLGIGSSGVRMVGIWGVGGSGKTTLAASLKKEISKHFHGHCTVENIRGETNKYGLKKLQENVLSTFFKNKVEVQSVEDGKDMIKRMLCHRKVLVLLDDVDSLDQLEALAGNKNWFGSESRIIITTRDEHLLRTHKVKHIYPIQLLSDDEATQLFRRHAYNEEEPVEDYDTFSPLVVSYAAGLPLSLKVLGSFLYDKNKNEWISALKKLKALPINEKVMNILKVSYDGLETKYKELFLDIACFWRFRHTRVAMEALEACGYQSEIGVKVLRQKALITISNDGMFDMHDLVQEMGHYIVRGEHPTSLEKHRRLWKSKEIIEMPFWDEMMEYDKIEGINYKLDYTSGLDSSPRLSERMMKKGDKIKILKCESNNECRCGDLSCLCKLVSKMKKLRLLIVGVDIYCNRNVEGVNFLSNELRYIEWNNYPADSFPDSFQPTKLVVLKLSSSKQKELWKGFKRLPHLKVLELKFMLKLLSTPDFDGLPRLQTLELHCNKLRKIHPSLEKHTSLKYLNICCHKLERFPVISQMNNIKVLEIMECHFEDGMIPSVIGELSSLEELYLSHNDFSELDFSLSQLTRLKILNLSYCNNLLELPELPSSLAILIAHECNSLTIVEDFSINCKELCQVSLSKDDGWSKGLLESMLKGKAPENGCIMHLALEGLEIPKGFTPPLFKGGRCRLEIPENWCNDFSGFLICVVVWYHGYDDQHIWINKEQVSGMDSDGDEVWENSDSDGDQYMTLVWYIPFGSLRHTTWWDPTYKALSFEFEDGKCSGFGVRLVEKESGITIYASSTKTDSSFHYSPMMKIQEDLASALKVQLTPFDYLYSWSSRKLE